MTNLKFLLHSKIILIILIFSKKFVNKMKKTYKKTFITYFVFNILILYYSMVFCSIYSASEIGWFNDTILALFIDFSIVSICIPIIKVLVRVIIRNFRLLRFLIIIDYSFFILNFLL